MKVKKMMIRFFLENVTVIEMLDMEIPLFPLSQVAMKN